MIKIKPFKAVFYNQEKLKDLSSVVCPPYDVISPAQQDYYHKLDPYNYIHVLLGKDVPGEDKYARAAKIFESWLKNKILIQDKKPAIYFYSQQYNIRGESKTRLGFISLLRLGDNNSPVFGHEHTRLEAKEDRLHLIRQVNANLSPIFIVARDNKRVIQRLYEQYAAAKPAFMEVTDNEKTEHKVWRIDAPEALAMVESGMLKEDAYIADGHHRYEVSCAYRDQMREKLGSKFNEESSFNYTLAYFTNTDQRGLSILPIHRLLKLDRQVPLGSLIPKLKDYFDVEEVKDKTRFFFLLEKSGRSEHVLGLYKEKKYLLLRLKNVRMLDKLIADKPKEYRTLDVAILNHIIFDGVLAQDYPGKGHLKYSPHAQEFIEAVDSDPLGIAFFLNPVKIEQIIAVALNGNKMPEKSTYFYPKVLSGLVINRHEEV